MKILHYSKKDNLLHNITIILGADLAWTIPAVNVSINRQYYNIDSKCFRVDLSVQKNKAVKLHPEK